MIGYSGVSHKRGPPHALGRPPPVHVRSLAGRTVMCGVVPGLPGADTGAGTILRGERVEACVVTRVLDVMSSPVYTHAYTARTQPAYSYRHVRHTHASMPPSYWGSLHSPPLPMPHIGFNNTTSMHLEAVTYLANNFGVELLD